MAGEIADSLIVLVLDRPVPYLGTPSRESSLLMLPLGDGSVLDRLGTEMTLDGRTPRQLMVAPASPVQAGYLDALRSHTRLSVNVMSLDEAGSMLSEHEPSDDLLLVDPQYWPVGGYNLADFLIRRGEYRGVTHAVALGGDPGQTHEWVERDNAGRVKAVPRFYDAVTWPQVANQRLYMTLLSARVVGPPPRFSSLGELRSLLAHGGMLSRDVAHHCDVYDLHDHEALLALSERTLAEWQLSPPGSQWAERERGVWIGRDCRIHPRARLVGPLAIHRRAVVEEGATLIGPSVVGTASRIGPGAMVAHSLLASGSVVAPGSAIRERVVAANGSASATTDAESPALQRKCVAAPGHARAAALRLAPARSMRASVRSGRLFFVAINRLLNALMASLGLVLLAPLGIVIGVLVKLDSPGPILFGHTREGKGGRPFRCWKFRTMTVNAHRRQRELYEQNEVDGPQFKLTTDPRITRAGRWLRAANLDELPQLLNVLCGDMNLVGPRPSPFRENQICVPWRRARLSVRPGITGLWQMCRHKRNGGDFHQWIFFDLTYIRHHSLRLDFKILLATLLTLGGHWSVPVQWLVRTDAEGAAVTGPCRSGLVWPLAGVGLLLGLGSWQSG